MKFFDYNTFVLFIGGICSILLPVFIIIGKQGHKRQQKREELEKLKDIDNVGDIESWLDASFEYKKTNFFQLMAEWCLQPLFIICISILFTKSGLYISLLTFFIVLFIFLHELWMAKRHSEKTLYQLFMIFIWIVSYLVIINNIV